jgi:hypothetical protein
LYWSATGSELVELQPKVQSPQPLNLTSASKCLLCDRAKQHNFSITEKEIVLKTVRDLPDDCSIDEIADRIEFLAAMQKGLDQLDRGEEIPHEEIKRQLASWLTN